MGRKPKTNPVLHLELLYGSQVHWEVYKTIDTKKGIAFLVTCGNCHRDRWVRRSGIRYKTFSGLCMHCCRIFNPPPSTKPGYKLGYTRSITSEGYVTLVISGLSKEDQELCKGMEQRNGSSPRVPEHRLVMARELGRPLLRTETVHHKHEPKTDNRPENLELRIGQHGKGFAEHDLISEIERLKTILDEHKISY